MKTFKTILFILIGLPSFSQMHEGKIVFERKTNLFKKYTEKSTQNYIKEENKYRTDKFAFLF